MLSNEFKMYSREWNMLKKLSVSTRQMVLLGQS